MNNFSAEMFGAAVSIFVAIIGVAALAVFLGKNSQTAAVIGAAGSAVSSGLAVAEGPVTGYTPGTNFGMGVSNLGFGA